MAPTSGHAATSPGPEGLAKNAGSAWMNRGRHGPRLCWDLSTDGGAIRPATIVNGCERYCVLFAPRVHATPVGSTGGGPAGGPWAMLRPLRSTASWPTHEGHVSHAPLLSPEAQARPRGAFPRRGHRDPAGAGQDGRHPSAAQGTVGLAGAVGLAQPAGQERPAQGTAFARGRAQGADRHPLTGTQPGTQPHPGAGPARRLSGFVKPHKKTGGGRAPPFFYYYFYST